MFKHESGTNKESTIELTIIRRMIQENMAAHQAKGSGQSFAIQW